MESFTATFTVCAILGVVAYAFSRFMADRKKIRKLLKKQVEIQDNALDIQHSAFHLHENMFDETNMWRNYKDYRREVDMRRMLAATTLHPVPTPIQKMDDILRGMEKTLGNIESLVKKE